MRYFGRPCYGKSSVREIDVDNNLVKSVLDSLEDKENASENLASTIKSFVDAVSIHNNQ